MCFDIYLLITYFLFTYLLPIYLLSAPVRQTSNCYISETAKDNSINMVLYTH